MMVRYSNGRPWIAPVLTTVGWFFSFLMIFLIPMDLHYTYTNDNKVSKIEKNGWLALSYTNSFLNYLVYPYIIAYIASAAFTRCGRLQNAVRRNCMFYLLYLIAGIAVGLAIVFSDTVK
jgi:hypothetical protein